MHLQLRKKRAAAFASTAVVLLSVLGVVGGASPAGAASLNSTLNFSGSAVLNDYQFYAGVGIPATTSTLGTIGEFTIKAQWNPTATVTNQYSQSLLRQGQTLDLVDTLTPGSGPLNVTYEVKGTAGTYNNDSGSGPVFPDPASAESTLPYDVSQVANGTCDLKLDGDGTYHCQSTADIVLVQGDLFGLFGIKIDVPFTTSFTVTPDGVVTLRSASISGGPTLIGPSTLTFHGPSPSSVSDGFTVPCTAPANNDLLYDLASSSSNPAFEATTTAGLHIAVTVVFTIGTTINLVSIPAIDGSFPLTAPSQQVDLGTVLANNVPPTVVLSTTNYTGNEGDNIAFDASGSTDICPQGMTYEWHFSDGGVAFGATPTHTFPGSGAYTGEVQVTDQAGNTSTADFAISVNPVSPSVNSAFVGTQVWGMPISFTGSAIDPGPGDGSSLVYTWTFGDGTSAVGPNSVHVYSLPGSYTATLMVCDGINCSSSAQLVTIAKRDTTTSNLGDTSGTFDTPASLSASLVDQFGNPINGRSISFQVGTDGPFSSLTNSSGIATRSYTPTLGAGAYVATASFGGDSLYNASSTSNGFNVALKATKTTYTGAVTGGANKTIVLSASLVDATGKALSGRTISFALGAQHATATTNASGVATVSLKLNQHNGTYTVSATFTPAGSDTTEFVGSSNATVFKLQTR
jgi:hypothetical protein